MNGKQTTSPNRYCACLSRNASGSVTAVAVAQAVATFGKLEFDDAKRLFTRLKERRPGDRVAYLFHHVLHPASQERLLKILQH